MGRGIGYPLTRPRFRGYGGGGLSGDLALALTGGADILGGATHWNSTILGVLVRWVPLAHPANSTLSIAMTGNFAANFNLMVEARSGGVYGTTVAYNGAYSTAAARGVDVLQTGALGKVHADFVRLVSGSNLQHWRDGEQLGLSGATGATTLGNAANLAINRRVSADTLPFGSMGFVEIRATTAALTDAQIRAACLAPVGTALPSGEVNAVVAADIVGTTIAPRVGGGTYDVTGSPPLTRYPVASKGLGTAEVIGDSIAGGRNASTAMGAGWRRECLQLVNASKHLTFNGATAPSDPATTLDFASNHTCVGGMGLGATPSAGTTRLSTVATDRALNVGPNGITILAFGANDIYRRIRELSESEATCNANMKADWEAEMTGMRVARTTGAFLVQDTINASDGVTTVAERAQQASWRAAMASYIPTWHATYSGCYLVDCHSALVAAYGSDYANNAAVLYDGTHPTPAAYTVMAAAYAAVLAGLP